MNYDRAKELAMKMVNDRAEVIAGVVNTPCDEDGDQVEHSRSMLFSLHAIYMDSTIRLSKDMRESVLRMAVYHACIAYEGNVKRGRELYNRTKGKSSQ